MPNILSMTQVLTISCKLKVSASQATKLDATKAPARWREW